MTSKNFPKYQDFSIDIDSEYTTYEQKTQLQSLPLTTVQSSKAIKKRDELRDRLSERIIHHPNEISPDETRAHDCLVIHDLLNKNPDIKLSISKNQRVKEALEIQEVRRTIVSTGLIFAGIPGYNWELGTYAHSYVLSIVPVNADFHNAELHYIAIISHRRSAYDLLKARGKRLIVIISSGWSFLLSTIIIFLTFVSVSPNIESKPARTQPDEESKLRDLPEELEDDLDTVSEEEWMQEQSKKSFIHNPIIPIQDFFSNNIPLPGHSIEESPCYDIIGSRPGEISTDTIYYCKLHPELGSIFLTEIELHCIQKEPDIHKSEILRLESQKQRGESA